ncbi:MAG: NADAR family protein [Chloroflexota bacterium]
MDLYQVYNVPDLISRIEKEGWQPKYVFFWSHTPKRADLIGPWCLSQWYPSCFALDGIEYATAEHYYMAEKARLFGDETKLEQILVAPHPGAAKQFGREISGFDDAAWAEVRFEVAVRGNIAKFSQNKELNRYLVNTKRRVLVEASPRDRIWGIGLTADDRRAEFPQEWLGLNLLGFALMKTRTELLSLSGEAPANR